LGAQVYDNNGLASLGLGSLASVGNTTRVSGNPQLAEALFPKLDSMAAAAAQPYRASGNAAGFVVGSKVVPSQTGAALDGASGADQPAVDARGDAYLWRSLGTWCAAYAFGAGVEAGASGGCADGAALAAGASCDVRCGGGYASQGEVTIACAAGAAAGDAVSGAIASGVGCSPGARRSLPFPRLASPGPPRERARSLRRPRRPALAARLTSFRPPARCATMASPSPRSVPLPDQGSPAFQSASASGFSSFRLGLLPLRRLLWLYFLLLLLLPLLLLLLLL
jgi:hypothetical protein